MTPTQPSPISTKLPPQQVARIQKSAQEFEAMALGQMLAPMFDTVDASKGPFGGGSGEEAWKPMMVSELGKQVAKAGGLGLARPVMEQMLRMQEAQPDAAAGAQAGPGAREQTAAEQLLLERPPLQRTTSQPLPQRTGA